jgi:hypothetical protein
MQTKHTSQNQSLDSAIASGYVSHDQLLRNDELTSLKIRVE